VRPTIAVIHPYWDFWESSVSVNLRADRIALLGEATSALAPVADIAVSTLLAPDTNVESLGRRCADVDAVVVVSTMAAPPSQLMSLLDMARRPAVVVWTLTREATLPDDFTHSDVTTRGATVGAPMVGSALARSGRPFDVALTTVSQPDKALDAVRRAGAAGRLRRATLLRIGSTIPGYTSVDASDERLADMGIQVVWREPEEVAARASDKSDSDVAAIVTEVRAEFDVDPAVTSTALERSARVELAMTDIVAEVGAIGGALNCHVPALRLDARAGVAPCLALGRLTSRGLPWTCAGDIVTSVAMVTVRALGYPTLYHEIEAVDHERDEIVLANTGEHDLGMCPGRPRLVPNVWYADDPVVGPCSVFSAAEGPASLVTFTLVADRARWVTAEGQFTGREAVLTGTPHAGFRFDSGHVGIAWPRWAAAGVTHHSVATTARLAHDIETVAVHLGAESVTV
jgi:L-arabinose isomerase